MPLDAQSLMFDTPPETEFDRLTDLVATLLDAPVSLLALIDDRRSFFKSAHGLPGKMAHVREVPLSHSLCRYVVQSDAELVIEDTRVHPLASANGAVTDLGVAAYLGVPVHGPDGAVFGSICAIGLELRRWSDRDRATLATLGKAIESEIALRVAIARQEGMLEELRGAYAAIDAARDVERELDERTRFFTSLSHEIRTPLNGVLGGVSLFEIASDDAARAEFAAMIRKSADALTSFVDDLVGFARDNSGRDAADLATFDPRAPLDGAFRLLAPAAAEKGLGLLVEIDPRVATAWRSDARRIERLLVNLTGNAIKFTRAGAVTLRLGTIGNRLVYRVVDTGPGIREEFRDCVFEPFDRGDPAVSRMTNGAGLGLSIARRSARLFGAQVRLESSVPGGGSCFLLSVPNG